MSNVVGRNVAEISRGNTKDRGLLLGKLADKVLLKLPTGGGFIDAYCSGMSVTALCDWEVSLQ